MTHPKPVRAVSIAAFVVVMMLSLHASAGGPQLQYVYGGSAGTVVFIHGMGECSTSMTGCNGYAATKGPVGYWTNRANEAALLNEATTRYSASGAAQFYEGFVLGYDLQTRAYWDSTADVGACLADLFAGTNASGCNPSKYQRTQIQLVTHSAGGAVVDRLLSTGWYGVTSHVVGNVISLAPALAGSRASSAIYGIDGYGGLCASAASLLGGWAIKSNASQSLTRGAVIAQANQGYQGRTPRWILKITTTGGSYSANNSGCGIGGGTDVRENDHDCEMGAIAGCLGSNATDAMDGLLYWSDSDPTNDVTKNNCPTTDKSCHAYPAFTGAYWHWFESWANHSHSRDDAYTTLGDWQTSTGCNPRSPGTCIGQLGLK